MTRVYEIIRDEDIDTLIGVVMSLTGGGANPSVVKAQAERIKQEISGKREDRE